MLITTLLLWLLLLSNAAQISAARHRNPPQDTTVLYSVISSDYNIFRSNSSMPTPQQTIQQQSIQISPSPTKAPTSLLETPPPSSSSVTQRIIITSTNSSNMDLEELASSGIIVELNTTADSYIRGGKYSDDNYGDATQLFLKNVVEDSSSPHFGRKAILKFDLRSIDQQTISEAFLQVYAEVDTIGGVFDNISNNVSSTQSSCIVQISRLIQSDWEEASVTWANLNQEVDQSIGYSYINSTIAVVMNQWITADVTSLIRDSSTTADSASVSLLLELISTEDDIILSLDSKESGLAPKLIIVLNKNDTLATAALKNVVSSWNQTAAMTHTKGHDSSAMQENPTFTSGTEGLHHGSVSTPTILTAAALTGVAFALVGLFTFRSKYFKNVNNHGKKPNLQMKHLNTQHAHDKLELLNSDSISGSASVSAINTDDDKTTSEPGSDESSIVARNDPCSWFKTLTAFQNTGGSTLGGTVVL
jgi:hypothetical protein